VLHEPSVCQGRVRYRNGRVEGPKVRKKEGWRDRGIEGGRVEEGKKEGRGTYDAPVRVIGAAAGQDRDCRKTECCPTKSLDSLKLAAPASMGVNEQVRKEMVFGELCPYREMSGCPWHSPPSRIPWNMLVETACTVSAVSAWRGSRPGDSDSYIPTTQWQ